MPRPKDPSPSPQQMETYRFIIGYICDHGFQPTKAEIARTFGVSINAITGRLKGLERHGLIKMSGYDRAIQLMNMKWEPRMVE